jgi:RNA polymerase sigma factor (sigma-70 family)
VLAIDLGTSGCKAAIVSLQGRVVGAARAAIGTIHLPEGGAEQDPDSVWSAVKLACRSALAGARIAPADVLAVIVALRHGAVRDCGHVGGYVHGTALNAIRGYFRRQRHQPRTVALGPGLVFEGARKAYDAEDRQKTARDAMALLDARDRQILALSLSEGLRPGEIAARLGMPAAAVRQRKCRALRAIVAFVGGGAQGTQLRCCR